jgi:hypothetical protein
MQQIFNNVCLPLAVLHVGVAWFAAHSRCPYCCLQDLEDLTQQLDATLGSVQPSAGSYTLGDDPLSSSAHLAGPSEHDMSYPTYGQLVTPTRDLQQQQQQAASAVGHAAGGSDAASSSVAAEPDAPGTSSSMADARSSSSSSPLHAVQQAPQPAAAQPQAAAAGYGAPPEPQDSMGSIPSPRAPAQQPGIDLPLVVSVSDPLRREAAGMLGMKGGRHPQPQQQRVVCRCPAASCCADRILSWPGLC